MQKIRQLFLSSAIVLGGLLTTGSAQSQTVPQATADARVQQRTEQLRIATPDAYDLNRYPIVDQNEKYWRQLLWSTAILEPQSAEIDRTIAQILTLTVQPNLTDAQKRTVQMAMQVGTQLYLSNPTLYVGIQDQFRQTLEQSSRSEWVAMSLSALTQSGATKTQQAAWSQFVQQRFPNWRNDVYLYTMLQTIGTAPRQTPPLRDLLNWTIAPRELQLYVLCRPDRSVLCTSVLRDRSGRFVQQGGQLWSVPLLTRSLHGLSGVFSRGQTPQGIYRIEGAIPQPDTQFFRAYGLFSLVNLFAPSEPGVKAFLPGQRGQLKTGVNNYQALLPPSWRNYFPMQQSYWAGKAGRSLFRIHGSGESPTFFENNNRYPISAGWNPAIGCLSALELYDDAGRLTRADMPNILSALTNAGGKNFTGYLIVVEVPGQTKMPISAQEVKRILAQ